jgi:phage terminase large subunit
MAAGLVDQHVTIPYRPRPLQRAIHAVLEAYRFVVAVCHRRFGKTVMAVNHLLKCALLCQKERGRFYYIAPTYRQGKAVAWDYLKHFAAVVPGVQFNESELRIDLPNGAQVRIFGADNPDSLRGLYADGVVLDEYGLMAPNVFSEVIRPLLSDRQGWAMFIGTPNGKNQFYDIAQKAKSGEAGWFFSEYRASQTGIVPAEELMAARSVMTSDEYLQEFECSFEASVKGAVYARELQQAREDGRVTQVPYDPALPVDTNWDLGYRDATAIWFTQSAYGGAVRVIDYYEHQGYGLDHYVQVVNSKGYSYAEHWLPHDVQQHELGTGKTLLEQLRQTLRPAVAVAPRLALEDGINAARLLFPRCWFDKAKCEQGLEALQNYKWDFNTRVKDFTHLPVHDWASHGADAFRTLGMRYQMPKVKKQTVSVRDRDPDDWRYQRTDPRRGGYR